MSKALILVRNFESPLSSLEFGEFTIHRIGPGFKQLREQFSSMDLNEDDWIIEKNYLHSPIGPQIVDIHNDIEDLLLLIRLFKAGDISFIRQASILPNGTITVRLPYRAINDLNSYSSSKYQISTEEPAAFQAFAVRVRRSPSWRSDWFATARRFFLSGGAKQFNPQLDDVDRIVDYTTALEATLVPEKDFNTRRISWRAGALLGRHQTGEAAITRAFVKKLYEIRSRIVHGSSLTTEVLEWLIENRNGIEVLMRHVLISAVENLPPEDGARRKALAGLYDPTDEDRRDLVLQKFKEIRSRDLRHSAAVRIAKLAGIEDQDEMIKA